MTMLGLVLATRSSCRYRLLLGNRTALRGYVWERVVRVCVCAV